MVVTLERTYSKEEIINTDFSNLVSIVREPNMCSGGIETIRVIIRESNLRHDASILEIGSNTGFSSLEFASTLPHAKVTGIDINKQSVAFSKAKAEEHGIKNVEFIQSDARTLPFEDHSFDLVFCSNVTSFINDRDSAISEYLRVLKPNGVLAAAPIYYREIPPFHIKKSVEEAIHSNIDVWDKSFWEETFEDHGLKPYFTEDFKYLESTREEIEQYISMVMSQEHLSTVDPDIKKAMENRLRYFYELFDKNLTYCGFSIMLYKFKPINPEPILHKSCRV